jgi:hypothetical protein
MFLLLWLEYLFQWVPSICDNIVIVLLTLQCGDHESKNRGVHRSRSILYLQGDILGFEDLCFLSSSGARASSRSMTCIMAAPQPIAS